MSDVTIGRLQKRDRKRKGGGRGGEVKGGEGRGRERGGGGQ